MFVNEEGDFLSSELLSSSFIMYINVKWGMREHVIVREEEELEENGRELWPTIRVHQEEN